MTNAEILSVAAIVIAVAFNIWQILSNSHKDGAQLEHRITTLETRMNAFSRFYEIIEDSVLKQLIHNPLTLEERSALNRYYARKADTATEDLLVGKAGLERELKELEDNPTTDTSSTIPYVMTIAAIDRRLLDRGYGGNKYGDT